MSKIAFFCIPAFGHTNPTIPVVKQLTDSGNQVRYYSYDIFKDKIESAGAQFFSCNKYDLQVNLTPKDGERISTDLEFATKIIVDTTLSMDKALIEEMRQWQPDCIVYDSMAFWGKLVALKLNIPYICSTTTFAFNRYSAQIMPQSFSQTIGTFVSMFKAKKHIKRLRENGYPVKGVLDIIANKDDVNTIVYTSKQFQPYSETFSDKYSFVGPCIISQPPFDKGSKKLIYISLGTVMNDNFSFYHNCIEAFKDEDVDVIMSVGDSLDIESLGTLPENIKVFKSVNQIQILSASDVFFTHCGMNSASEGLYFGVPLVLFAQTTEQRGVGARVEQLGAGIPLKESTASAIKAAAHQLLTDPACKEKALEISKSFHQCGGANMAEQKIMSVIQKIDLSLLSVFLLRQTCIQLNRQTKKPVGFYFTASDIFCL